MADPPISTRAPESDAMEGEAPGTEYSTPLPTPLPHRLDPVRGVSDFGHLFSKQPTPSTTHGETTGVFPTSDPVQSSGTAPSSDPPPHQVSRQDTLDAMEDSPIPHDSQAQTGISMGEHCTTDRPISDQSPAGQMTNFGDIDVYVSKPADYPQSPSRLLLLLTGGTGVHSINNQIQADKYAAAGFVVIMPDQFFGDPAPNTVPTTDTPDPNPSIIEQVKLRAAETAKSFMLDMWLARHTPEKTMPIIHQVLDSAKDEYADAVAHGGGVYAAGYCFGAKYVIILAGEHPSSPTLGSHDEEQGLATSTGPLIKSAAIAHGTSVTIEDVTAIKAPIAMVCVENDQLFPTEVLDAARQHLQTNNIEHQIKIFPGVPHGFAIVGDYTDEHIQQAQRDAFGLMKRWLVDH